MKLYFYLDKNHFPPAIPHRTDDPVLKSIDNRNTWYAWTIKTYLFLKGTFECELTANLPESGIILYFRGSMELRIKPTTRQFFVCMVGDGSWHPYAPINVFQNFFQSRLFPNGFFMQHWLINDIVANPAAFENNQPAITHFGDPVNLDPYFSTPQWPEMLEQLGFKWVIKDNDNWNDYRDVDILLAIRKFNTDQLFVNKPASKLINAWHGRVIPILGNESAYHFYRTSAYDYLQATNVEELRAVLIELKNDPVLVNGLLDRGKERKEQVNNAIIKAEWIGFINGTVYPQALEWYGAQSFSRAAFIAKRWLLYRANALLNKFTAGSWLSIK